MHQLFGNDTSDLQFALDIVQQPTEGSPSYTDGPGRLLLEPALVVQLRTYDESGEMVAAPIYTHQERASIRLSNGSMCRVLAGGVTKTIQSEEGYGDYAIFDDLSITVPGSFKFRVLQYVQV
ncbi:hypothetical protein IWQ60_009168 [Tieghemiomyces parasiticus]|uniref:Uncharacterized protein n=1 Tax=Tieghemiomyces parasiticus TaxID=78921 RepID=A0A9W7ZP21_9FUNG|nr:hypothetical protein IWQ60_009168 [Tieghemiomyces parasiticus]